MASRLRRWHRYVCAGLVQGLTRVRTFSQDDAHIFCTLDQVQGEIVAFLDLVHEVYRTSASATCAS